MLRKDSYYYAGEGTIRVLNWLVQMCAAIQYVFHPLVCLSLFSLGLPVFPVYLCRSLIVKGIVQQDLTWVKTRLKRSVLMNYIVAKFAF
jgi:hypothetical protein